MTQLLEKKPKISNATLVGSRELPPTPDVQLKVLQTANRIAKRLVELEVQGWSGGAPGLDQIWRKLYIRWGGEELFHQLLPWENFEGFSAKDDRNYLLDDFMNDFAYNTLFDCGVVWINKLSQGIRKLYQRNVFQVLTIDWTKTDVVFYYAPVTRTGAPKGGTAIAVRFAEALGIPTFNLGEPDQRRAALEFLDLEQPLP